MNRLIVQHSACETCGAVKGARCRTKGGNVCLPHWTRDRTFREHRASVVRGALARATQQQVEW